MLKQSVVLRQVQESVGSILAFIPLTPNQWTLLALLLAVGGSVAIAYYNYLVLGILFFVLAAFLDFIDGAVARARGEMTKMGGFLDGVSDRFVEALFLFSFMFYPLPTIFIDPKIWLALLIFLGTCMPSFIRAYAHHKEVVSKNKALALGGICERSERLMIIIIGLAAGIYFTMESFMFSIILASILSIFTIIQRLLQIKRSL